MQVGRFTLLETLGEGAFGAVYLAEYGGAAGFRRKVAVKVLKAEIAREPELLEKFKVEAHIGSVLQHENVVQVIDFEEINGQFVLTMEYVRGALLRHLMSTITRSRRVLPLHVVWDIVLQVARGLDYAHRASGPDGRPLNLIHRDLKPPNIMLSTSGVAKVMDFGIARVDFARTHSGVEEIKGTFAYMSPEQTDPLQDLTQATNQFSLGLILCEMVKGSAVYRGELYHILDKARRRDLGDTIDRVGALWPEVVPTLSRILSLRPEDRFGSMAEFVRVFETVAPARGSVGLKDMVEVWMEDPSAVVELATETGFQPSEPGGRILDLRPSSTLLTDSATPSWLPTSASFSSGATPSFQTLAPATSAPPDGDVATERQGVETPGQENAVGPPDPQPAQFEDVGDALAFTVVDSIGIVDEEDEITEAGVRPNLRPQTTPAPVENVSHGDGETAPHLAAADIVTLDSAGVGGTESQNIDLPPGIVPQLSLNPRTPDRSHRDVLRGVLVVTLLLVGVLVAWVVNGLGPQSPVVKSDDHTLPGSAGPAPPTTTDVSSEPEAETTPSGGVVAGQPDTPAPLIGVVTTVPPASKTELPAPSVSKPATPRSVVSIYTIPPGQTLEVDGRGVKGINLNGGAELAVGSHLLLVYCRRSSVPQKAKFEVMGGGKQDFYYDCDKEKFTDAPKELE